MKMAKLADTHFSECQQASIATVHVAHKPTQHAPYNPAALRAMRTAAQESTI
jgi:hypothetical protein